MYNIYNPEHRVPPHDRDHRNVLVYPHTHSVVVRKYIK